MRAVSGWLLTWRTATDPSQQHSHSTNGGRVSSGRTLVELLSGYRLRTHTAYGLGPVFGVACERGTVVLVLWRSLEAGKAVLCPFRTRWRTSIPKGRTY